MDLVLLLDLKAKVFDEYLYQCGGYVLQAGVKGRNQAGIKLNKIHPGIQGKNSCIQRSNNYGTVLNLIQHMGKIISISVKIINRSIYKHYENRKMLISCDHVLYSINYSNSEC